MIVNKQSIDAVFKNLNTLFLKAFNETPSNWKKVAMKVPSSTKQEDYAWLSNFPKMTKWIGEKTIKRLKAFKYVIVNDDYEATIEVDRNDFEDDTLGIYAPQAQMAGASAKEFPDDLVFEAINKGFETKCYDGQYFFDTDHPVGEDGKEVPVSNKGTAPLSNANRAAADASFGAGRTAMREFTNDEGRKLNPIPDILLVPPALYITAKSLMEDEKLADDTPNPYRGLATVVEESRLTSDTAWFLLDTSKPVKPIVYQERKVPKFVKLTNPESDLVFRLKKFLFGVEARGAGGYGFWQLAYGSTGKG